MTQTFFSLSLGWGGIINYASYSNFHSNMFLNAVIVGIINQGRKYTFLLNFMFKKVKKKSKYYINNNACANFFKNKLLVGH